MKIINPFEPSKRQFIPSYRKPSFQFQSTKSVVVPAGTHNPAYFVIGGVPFQSTTNLECNLTINGPGGLNTGSLAASTIYYLYAILANDGVSLLADLQDPSVGPSGYTLWTYLGAFGTKNLVAEVVQFRSNGGFCVFSDNIQTPPTGTSAVTYFAMNLKVPLTTRFVYGQPAVTLGASTDAASFQNSSSSTDEVAYVIGPVGVTSGIIYGSPCFIPTSYSDARVIYAKTSTVTATARWETQGWREFPEEWQ